MRARILFATLTGNNEDVADVIIAEFQRLGVETIKEDITNVEALDLNPTTQDILVTVVYTFDLGTLADEAIDFYEDLPDVDLAGVVYGVAGSGDVYYGQDYGTAVDILEQQFTKTQGIQGAPGVKVNLRPDAQATIELEQFTQALVKQAQRI
ncbi:flavodoxin [Weissella coleopterorum]|uniref:Flavodoxin n=1 Tax=Weissella coleopterorum TaxID=2714949 RepID=A0A6G8B238_9LACO|nr:flavodoxin domain-containing protein [Weissella coleopterorum]QIL51289.1 flavodoxin [Weissella coleopterorum]